jgi:hypothetical protein
MRSTDALLSAIEREVLHPEVLEMAVARAAERLRPSIAEIGAELSPLYAEWAADLGGDSELSAAQWATLRRSVDAYEIASSAIDNLPRSRGSLTNERNAKAIATFNAATDRLFRGVALLGLERRDRGCHRLSNG